ncbi:MAG: 6-bladed beta-propeller [Bacteroidota bacterium]
MKTAPYIISFLLLLVATNGTIYCQDTLEGRVNASFFYVKWVKQYPPADGQGNNAGSYDKFKDFIFGKKDLAEIKKPMCVLASSPDTFLLMDQANGLIFDVQNVKYEVPRHLRKKFGNFTSLVDMCELPGGEILFTDSHLKSAYKITAGKKDILSFTDTITLIQPTGIAYSKATDEIWIVETGAHRISVFDRKGKLLRRIGQRGNGNREFNFPTYIWIDKDGTVYLVDTLNYRIQILDKNGNFVFSFGEMGDATGYLARPKGIATDSKGNIYVADALFHCVQIFDKSGRYLYNFGKQGHNQEEFWMPSGIYIDKKDFIYVADSYNARVQIFQLRHNDQD